MKLNGERIQEVGWPQLQVDTSESHIHTQPFFFFSSICAYVSSEKKRVIILLFLLISSRLLRE